MTGPTFLVIGAARSGTTGLVEGLRTHPDVFVTEPKEPHYFALHRTGARFTAPGDEHTINRVAITDRDAYLALYATGAEQPARGDASVSSLYYHQESLPEIRRMNPDMRLVLLLREPVARAWSSHQYMRARGLEPVEDFLAAVGQEERRKRLGWHHLWHYTSMSRYADALEAAFDTFSREQVGVWFHDDLEADYVGTVGSILRFLGVPPAEGEAAGVPRVNVSGRPRYAPAHRAIGWATGHEQVRALVKAGTSYRLREAVRRSLLRTDPVPEEVRSALAPTFASERQRLSALLPGPAPDWISAGATG